MSSIYASEPTVRGFATIHTSFGSIDVEFWPKEAPKAVKNFIQRAAEGYYDGVIFHRVVKGSFIQTGDPTGTGAGGESIYGGPFADEFHPRIRFNHRGQLAMSNDNLTNAKQSQFFFTLDATPWLEKKHTIFGRIAGSTFFNAQRIGEVDVDKDDRPLEPPRILRIEIVDNPVPEVDVASILDARRARLKAALVAPPPPQRAPRTGTGKGRVQGGKHLLSFAAGDDEEDEKPSILSGGGRMLPAHAFAAKGGVSALAPEVAEEDASTLEAATGALKRGRSELPPESTTRRGTDQDPRHDLVSDELDNDTDDASAFAAAQRAAMRLKRARFGVAGVAAAAGSSSGLKAQKLDAESEEPAPVASAGDAATADYVRLREELRASRKAATIGSGAAAAATSMLTPLQEMRAKYKARQKELGKRESDTLAKLQAFQATLKGAAAASAPRTGAGGGAEVYSGQILEDDEDKGDTEEGRAWMAHRLKFRKHIDDSFRAGANDGLETIDPLREQQRGGDTVGRGDARGSTASGSRGGGGRAGDRAAQW